jgi:hypothetical protein
VAVAVHPQLDYAECARAGTVYYVAAGLAGRYPALGQPHLLYICAETLAVELRRGPPPTDWMAREIELAEARVNVAVVRA